MKKLCGASIIILLALVLVFAKSSYSAKIEIERYRQAIKDSQSEALDAIVVELEDSSTQYLSYDAVYQLYFYSQIDPTEKYYKLAVNLLELTDPTFYAKFSVDERNRLANDLKKCDTMDDAEYYEFLLTFAELVSEYWFGGSGE